MRCRRMALGGEVTCVEFYPVAAGVIRSDRSGGKNREHYIFQYDPLGFGKGLANANTIGLRVQR